MNYRADIDGLRAIAVLSVVLFHLDIPGFQGGFIGVDVFFVISGYLITSLIKHKYENRNFRFSDFYLRRIRRLFPPLIATVAATLLGATFIMMPYNMEEFARSAVAAIFSVSNFVFYWEAGYWDTASELKPLLHTWSLGVEEQFYLFWPAVIVGLLSIRRFVSFGISLALISLFGAALCIWYTPIDESATFYLLPFRIFQFSVGALIIPLTSDMKGNVAKSSSWMPIFALWSGIFCISASVFFLGDNTTLAEWQILLPTSGAALFLLSGALPGQIDAFARMITQNSLMIWLGRVSYSMYLVHWPLIVLYRYHYDLEFSYSDQWLLATGTLLATCAMHYGVERRFYRRAAERITGIAAVPDGIFALRTGIVASLLALIGSSAWLGGGWAWRFPSLTLNKEEIDKNQQTWLTKYDLACDLKDLQSNPACNMNADIQVLIIGNSHRADAYNFINAAYGDDKDINLILFKYPNTCNKFFEKGTRDPLKTKNEKCRRELDKLFESVVIPHIDIVIYGAKKPYIHHFYLAILRQLRDMNPRIRFVTFGGYIYTKKNCVFYINRAGSTDACALPENVAYFEGDLNQKDSRLMSEFREIESHYIDRVDLLCKNRVLETCRTRTDDGIPALYDSDHNSFEFSEMSGKMYARKHPDLLRDLVKK